MVKILYFDTNAILKLFLQEKGSDLIKWIVENRVVNSFTLHTSQTALFEFPLVLKRKVQEGALSDKQRRSIMTKSKHYFQSIFRIRDFSPIPGFKKLLSAAVHGRDAGCEG